ncbi:MAG: hypothetical protein HY553_17610, partial [Elusimicrobia bacterium]|nr:hypothetical protein [Elusimicrobiota bacterium]
MTKQLRMIVAATLVFGQTLPAAAQRVVTEVAPVAVRGPAAVSVAPAATLGTAASLQRAPLALAAPVVAPAPILGAKAGAAAKATPLAAIQAHRQAIAGAMPKAQVSSLAPAAAYS